MASVPNLAPQAVPHALIQQISIGGTLNGTAPVTPENSSYNKGRKIWAAAATGGLFDFAHTDNAVTLCAIEMILGGQTVWNVYITDGVTDTSANDLLIASGTNETSVFLSEVLGSVFLLPGQKVKITTTGNATSLWRITIKGAKTYNEGGLFI